MRQKIEDRGKQFKANSSNKNKFKANKEAVKQIRLFLQILENSGWEGTQVLFLMTALSSTIGAMFILNQ